MKVDIVEYRNYITTITKRINIILCYESQHRRVAISEVSVWADEARAPVAVVTGSSVKEGAGESHAVI